MQPPKNDFSINNLIGGGLTAQRRKDATTRMVRVANSHEPKRKIEFRDGSEYTVAADGSYRRTGEGAGRRWTKSEKKAQRRRERLEKRRAA